MRMLQKFRQDRFLHAPEFLVFDSQLHIVFEDVPTTPARVMTIAVRDLKA